MHYLNLYYQNEQLYIPNSCGQLRNAYSWSEFKDKLYQTNWNAEIKETFNGNAIVYLGRYVNRIAITNTKLLSITKDSVSFSAKDYKTGMQKTVTISCVEFIRRFMMHVLPSGFQKIRYYGYLNNRWKKRNLSIIFRIQGHRRFKTMFSNLPMDEILQKVWNYNIHICPKCGCNSMRHCGRTFSMLK